MSAVVSESVVGDSVGHDFLFTWVPEYWPRRKFDKLFGTFRSRGIGEEWWTCKAHKKIRPGDHAYLLKQRTPIGIFGRGTVVGEPRRKLKPSPGESKWQVLIGFERSRGDVLCDPQEQFLVNESQLLSLPIQKKQWQNQASGITLKPNAAHAIDSIILDSILDSVLIGRGETTLVDEVAADVARRKKLSEQWRRPDQQHFSKTIRKNYRDKCAVTGCVTHPALEAAHISTRKESDNNSPANGILLRSDIHALFDRFLITLSEDGTRVEVSSELTDPSYKSLNTARVARPDNESSPSAESIRQHRNLFFERRRRCSGNRGKQKPAIRPS